MHPTHRPNDILVSCLEPLLALCLPVCSRDTKRYQKCGFCSFITQKGSCFQQCIILQLSTVLLSLQPGDPNKYITKPANYSFTQCDSRQSSPILLARHQSVLMCSHKGNQHANLMEIYKHQQRTTGIILITSLP